MRVCCRVPRRNTTKVFVGNLKTGVTDAELRALFEQYGAVVEADVCGGFGFVVSSANVRSTWTNCTF